MRIKMYEDFTDRSVKVEKMRKDLEDIFVELRDDNYSVKVNALQYDITPFQANNYFTHYEVILVSNSGIDLDGLSEYVMMFKDYLSDYRYENMKWHSWSLVRPGANSEYRVDLDFDEIIPDHSPNSSIRFCAIKISFFVI
jgi:hypothetical protein